MSDYRIESDSLGEVNVPAEAYYGAQTQRAIENFPISGKRMPREFIRALGIIKWAAAEANMELGFLDRKIGKAISQAATEVVEGNFDSHFVVVNLELEMRDVIAVYNGDTVTFIELDNGPIIDLNSQPSFINQEVRMNAFD